MANLFNLRFIVFIVSILEGARFAILQAVQSEVIPSGAWEIARDFPILAVVLLIGYFMVKWADRMLISQQDNMKEIYSANRADVKEIYAAHQQFVADLVLRLQDRQNNLEISNRELVETMCEIKELLEKRVERRSNLG